MSSSPVPPPRFAWPQLLLVSVVVFAGFQLAAWRLVGVEGMDTNWWVGTTLFSLVGGLLVALTSGRPTQVIVREVVHVAAAPSRPTPAPEPSVVVNEASLAAARADAEAQADVSAPVAPAPTAPSVPSAQSAQAVPHAHATHAMEPEPSAPPRFEDAGGERPKGAAQIDASAVVQAAFAAAPSSGLEASTPPSRPQPAAVQASSPTATAVTVASALPSEPAIAPNAPLAPAVALASEWAEALSQVAAPLLPVAERWEAAPSVETTQAARTLIVRLAVLRELLAPSDPVSARSGTSLRRFVDSIVSHVADQPSSDGPIRGLVRDDLADFWAFDARRLRRTLELLASELLRGDAAVELHLLVTKVRLGDGSALQFEFREDRPRGGAAPPLDASGLVMRVVAWLVSSLQGRLELPVQARGDQRVLIRIPAERIAEEESAFPAVEQSGSHLVVPPRPHTPTTTNVVQTLSRVLVVDDDAMSRWSLTGQLAIHGFVADTAPNGSAAIKCLTERGYRAVLLDLYMPDETGFAVAARIRALEGDVGRVPIVGLTLRATADEQRRCREVGIDDCVIKPVRGEELAEVLHGLPVRHEPVGPQPHAAGPSAAAEEEPPTLDTATLDRLAAIGRASGDPDLGERLVRLFDQKAPHAVAGIRAALGQNELQDAAHIARRLAESSSVIGARRMESLARAALKAADAGDAGKLAEVVEALEAAYHRVKSVLRARVGSSDVR